MYANKLTKRVREKIISLTLYFLFFLFLILTGIFTFACTHETKYFVEVFHRDYQKTVLSIEVFPEEFFYIEYTNSRDLNPIIDVFQVGSEGCLYLIEERYPWFGVGQECHPSKEIFFKDGMVVVKINQKIRELPLRVAYTVIQILRVRDQEYPLHHFAESGEPLTVLITIKGGHNNSE